VTYENITKFVQQAVTVTDCGLEISIIGLCCVVFLLDRQPQARVCAALNWPKN